MPIAYIHSFAHAGLLTDITEMLDTVASPNYDEKDFLTGMYDTYSRYNGMQVAFPFKPDSMVFFYRKDLFEDENLKSKFKEKYGRELTVPATPEEMLEVAEFFTKSENPDSPVDYGYSGVLSKGSSRFTWFNHLGYFGGEEIGDNFTPGFTDGSGVKALQFMLDLVKFAPKESITFDWDTGNTYFAQGNAAMMEQWPGLYMNCEADGSPQRERLDMVLFRAEVLVWEDGQCPLQPVVPNRKWHLNSVNWLHPRMVSILRHRSKWIPAVHLTMNEIFP